MRKIIIPVLVVLVIAGAAAGILAYNNSQVRMDGASYSKDVEKLDLSGSSLPDLEIFAEFTGLKELDLRGTGLDPQGYEYLKSILPDCNILWELPFQNKFYPLDTDSLRITALTAEDVVLLDYLTELTYVDATNCRNYPQILALQERRPECTVEYAVELKSGVYPADAAEVDGSGMTVPELQTMLPLLTALETVDLSGSSLTGAETAQIAAAFPDVLFLRELELCGMTFSTDVTEIDISGIPVEDPGEIEALLPCFSRLEKVIMCDCGLSNEEMDALNKRHEDVRFVWRVDFEVISARTDDTWFAPMTQGIHMWHNIDDLKYCTDMVCIDIGHANVTNCSWAAYMPNLKYLLIADTRISDLTPLEGLENLVYLEIFMCPITDYSPLLQCPALEDLNVGYTSADPTPLAQMKWLKNLWWANKQDTHWHFQQETEALLREALPDTYMIFYEGSSTGFGWRHLPHYFEQRDILGMWYMDG